MALDINYGTGIDLGIFIGCWTYIRDCANGFSVALWIKPNSQPNDSDLRGVLGSLTGGVTNGFSVYYKKENGFAQMRFTVRDYIKQKIYLITKGHFPSTGEWAHYTFTYYFPSPTQGPILIGYVNGNMFPDLTVYTISQSHPGTECNRLVVGWFFTNLDPPTTTSPLTEYADVVIDDVMIFETVLTGSEAEQLVLQVN